MEPDWYAPPSIGPPRLPENTRVKSGPDGSFSLPDLIAATYRVYAYAMGYLSTAAPDDVVVARGQKVTGVKIALRPAASITGTLYGTKGQPLGMTGLSVRIRGERHESPVDIMTDEDGRYSIETLPPDKYSIEVKCEDGGHATLKVSLADGETATGVDLHLTADTTLTLRVTDPDGNPAADAEVSQHVERLRRVSHAHREARAYGNRPRPTQRPAYMRPPGSRPY